MNCKICSHEKRQEIESLIVEKGLSYTKAAVYCKELLGFNISHTSIKRHCDDHIDGYSGKTAIIDGLSEKDVTNALQSQQVIAEQVSNSSELKAVLATSLPQLVANQLAIALDKQSKNMSGNGSSAAGEIETFNKLLSALKMVVGDSKNDITDIDKLKNNE